MSGNAEMTSAAATIKERLLAIATLVNVIDRSSGRIGVAAIVRRFSSLGMARANRA